eukprot:SAG31_NODE_2438_length_5695_cov_2.851501_1_plen_148_part_00
MPQTEIDRLEQWLHISGLLAGKADETAPTASTVSKHLAESGHSLDVLLHLSASERKQAVAVAVTAAGAAAELRGQLDVAGQALRAGQYRMAADQFSELVSKLRRPSTMEGEIAASAKRGLAESAKGLALVAGGLSGLPAELLVTEDC